MPNITIKKQDNALTTEELYELVKSLTILDEDNEVNLTKIGKLFGKRVDKFKQANADFLDEIGVTQNGEAQLLRIKYSIDKEQGTFTSSPEVLLEFLRYCNPRIAVKMNTIIKDLFTKGYTSIDGKERLTLEEHHLVALIVSHIQYKDNCKETIKQAVEILSSKYLDNKYAKANLEFNQLANYNLKDIDKDYEQMCLVYGNKELKSLSKFDKLFQAQPDKLIQVVLTAIEIVYDLNIKKLTTSVFDYKNMYNVGIVKDDKSIGTFGIIHMPNNESLIELSYKETKHLD